MALRRFFDQVHGKRFQRIYPTLVAVFLAGFFLVGLRLGSSSVAIFDTPWET